MALNDKDIYSGSGKPFDSVIKNLQEYNEELKESIKQSKEYSKTLEKDLKKAIDGLGKSSGSRDVSAVNRLNDSLKKTTGNTVKLTAVQKEFKAQMNAVEKANAKLDLSESKYNKELIKTREEIRKKNAELKKEAKIEKSASDSLVRKKKLLSKLNEQYDYGTKELRDGLIPQISHLRNEINKLEKERGNHTPNVGNYASHWDKVSKVWFKATGIIAGVGAIVAGFVKMNSVIISNARNTRTISNLFNIAGKEARDYAIEIKAIAESFSTDFKDTAKSINVITKEFGLTNSRAIDLVKNSLLLTDNSGEFLEQVKEYSTQFASAGGSASEFLAFLIQTERRGVFNDKGVDAIKEGSLSLREQTKAVQDALRPLKEKQRLEIENLSMQGKTLDAIKLLSEEMNKNYLTTQQIQAIYADVFKGAGEDAGRFIMELKDLNLEFDDLKTNMTEAEASSIDLTEAWTKFTSAFADDANTLGKTATWLKNFFATGLTDLTLDLSDDPDAKLKYYGEKLAQTEKEIRQDLEDVAKEYGDSLIKTAKIDAEMREETIKGHRQELQLMRMKGNESSKEYKDLVRVNAALEKELDIVNSLIKAEELKTSNSDNTANKTATATRETIKFTESLKLMNAELVNTGKAVGLQADSADVIVGSMDSLATYDKGIKGFVSNKQIEEKAYAVGDAFSNLAYAYEQATSAQLKAIADRVATYDSMIADSQSNLSQELKNKEAGLANTYDSESKRIDQMMAKRAQEVAQQEKIVKRQVILSRIAQGAQLVEATANVFKMNTKNNPFGVIVAIAQIAAMMASFASTKSQIEGFKDGVVDYHGKGTETSDSNIVRIANRESVIKAESSKKSIGTLSNINEGVWSDKDILPAMEHYKNVQLKGYTTTDSQAIRDNTEALRGATSAFSRRGNSRRKVYINGKLQ